MLNFVFVKPDSSLAIDYVSSGIVFVLPFSCSFIWCIYITCLMIYWFIQINLIEITFYVVMTPVAIRIGRRYISRTALILWPSFAREDMERTQVRHVFYSYCGLPFLNCIYVSVACVVLNALLDSSFELSLPFSIKFLCFNSNVIYLCIYLFVCFVLVTCVIFLTSG